MNPIASKLVNVTVLGLKKVLFTTLICLFIAAFTSNFDEGGYGLHLRIALVFGLSITVLVNVLRQLPWSLPPWACNAIGLFGGFSIGMLHLLSVLADNNRLQKLSGSWEIISFYAAFSLVICAVVFYLFVSTYRVQTLRREVAEQAAMTAQKEHQLAVSELRVLQSQIEPHFLFNTLATMQGLVDSEPQQAKQMIQSLASMLRVSLQRSRNDKGTLAQELSLISDYLAIQKIRLGKRLTYNIKIPAPLTDCSCPPLLLQPLVENALVHGIEPCAEGGTVTICAQDTSGNIVLTIENTGVAFGDSQHQGSGMGLQNVRERLHALYPQQSHLRIQPLADTSGTCVQISFPLSNNL